MDAYQGSTVLEERVPFTGIDNLLELRRIVHAFSGLKVLQGFDLPVPRGSITGLIGPNGSGKTTCFNIATGFLRPNAGEVLFAGERVTAQPVDRLARMGLVRTFQTPLVFDEMTVLENVEAGFHISTQAGWLASALRLPQACREQARTRDEARAICKRFELDGVLDTLAGRLPAGRKRIVELARAWAAKPRLLMLDEPSSGLNTAEIEVLQSWIEWMNAQGVTILLVSHDMGLMNVAHRVHALYFGQVIASGAFADVQRDPRVREAYLGV